MTPNLPQIHPNDFDNLDKVRQWIQDLQDFLKDFPQVELPLKHYYSKGVYGREIFMAKDSLVIGKIHKHQTMNVITKGKVTVLSVEGVKEITAPFTFVSQPGAKRVVFVHEDCTWSTFHCNPTETQDLLELEEQVIAKTYDEVVPLLPAPKEIKCIG